MKLEILLGLVSLVLSPSGGEANIQVHKNVLLHGSLRMSYSPSQNISTIRSVAWRFVKINEQVTILDITEKPYYVYPSKFKGRLQVSENLHTLTIVDLTMKDGGMYTVDVTDVNGVREAYSFNVTVYEPVPIPSIRSEVKENVKDRCNITLHCSVPANTSDFSYTWECGDRKSDCQLYNNGSTVQIFLNDSKDMKIMCIVQNPVDKKNVSFYVQEKCMFRDERSPRSHHSLIIITVAIVIVMVPIIVVISIKMKRGIRKEPTESRNTEMHYIEVTTRQREDNQRVQMENDHYIGMPSPKRTKAETVYTTLKHPPPIYT